MSIEVVAIDSIQPDPQNARAHPEESIVALKRSLERFGQRAPLTVDAAGVIRKGNGLHQAARELGWTQIAIERREDLIGDQAEAYALVDNRSAELSGWRLDLGNVIADLTQGDPWTPEDFGWTPQEIADMVAANVPEPERQRPASQGDGAPELVTLRIQLPPDLFARWLLAVERFAGGEAATFAAVLR